MSSGADQSSRDMIEMPLYHGRNLYHLSSKSFCTSCGIFLKILCPETDDHLHINCLDMLVVIVTVHIWGKKLKGKTLLIFCDNEASVTVINSGSTKSTVNLSLLCLKKRAKLEHAYSGTWKCLNRTTLYPTDIFTNLTRTKPPHMSLYQLLKTRRYI
jgi:hypothetical protein